MAKGGIAVWNSPESKFTSVEAWATSKARLSWSTLIFFLSLRQEKFVAALNESYVNCFEIYNVAWLGEDHATIGMQKEEV